MIARGKVPLSLIILPFTIGLAMGAGNSSGRWTVTGLLLVGIIVYLFLFYKDRSKPKANYSLYNYCLLQLMFLGLGMLQKQEKQYVSLPQSCSVFQITSSPVLKNNKYRCRAKAWFQGMGSNSDYLDIRVYFSNPKRVPSRGDFIYSKKAFSPIPETIGDDQFQYRKWMLKKGIGSQLFLFSNQFLYIGRVGGYDFKSSLARIREKLKTRINTLWGTEDLSAIINAILIGDRSRLNKEQKDRFASLGMVHVLAVSGLHVGLIFLILDKIIGKWRRTKSYLYILVHGMASWSYAILTGLSASVVRASVMLSVWVLASIFKRKSVGLNTMLFALILMLIREPNHLYDIGFQFSFLALSGILILAGPIEGVLIFQSQVGKLLWKYASVSIAAHLSTVALAIYYFGQHPNLFLVANLFLVPFLIAMMYLGLISLLISGLSFWLAAKFAWLNELLYQCLDISMKFLSSIPYYRTQNLVIENWELVSIYTVFILTVFSFFHKSKKLLFFAAVLGLLCTGLSLIVL